MIENYPPGTRVRVRFKSYMSVHSWVVTGRTVDWLHLVNENGNPAKVPEAYLEIEPSPLEQLAEVSE